MPEVVIIGAGLTGLSAAYHLEQNNFFDFAIYEKNSRAGGLMRSEQNDGFTFDYTGHFLHVNDHNFYNFLNTISSIDHFDKIQRSSSIYTHNTYVAYPIQMNLFGLPTEVICECIENYVKRPRSKSTPKTFYEWVLKYFGKGFGNHFFFTYNSKLLAYPIKKIHHSWTGRFVPQTSLNNIIKGAVEKNPHEKVGYNSCFYYPKMDGIESLIKNLTQKISSPIFTNHEIVAIDQTKKIITFSNGKKESYNTLITTAPLDNTLKSLSSSSSTNLAHATQKLWCNAVINFNLGFSTQNIGQYQWLYFPEKAYQFYRLGFWHNVSRSLVAPNCSSIYGELSYQPRKNSRGSMQKKVDAAIAQTLAFLNLTNNDIKVSKTLEINHGYVAYDAWREKNAPKIITLLKNLNIHSTGRFGAWKYSSMQEAYCDGKEAADYVLTSSYALKKVSLHKEIMQQV